jgi:hypothetical protein
MIKIPSNIKNAILRPIPGACQSKKPSVLSKQPLVGQLSEKTYYKFKFI